MDRLESIVKDRLGPDSVIGESQDTRALQCEWRERWSGQARLIVAPGSTEQVSELVRICATEKAAIVTQGGNTGLCGGAIPDASRSQVLLLTRRLNGIEPADTLGATLVAEAGCTLRQIQDAAADAGLLFPLSIASEGSATIGGAVATNAGGIHVLRYGSARNQILGLEVVLANGSVYNGLTRVRKNNIGYDLPQLFAGSEGTLGVITRVALQLQPRLPESLTVFAELERFDDVPAFFHALRQDFPTELSAFELIDSRAFRLASQYLGGQANPFSKTPSYAVLLELQSGANSELPTRFERAFSEGFGSGFAGELVVAQSSRQRESMWRLRHSISAAQKPAGVSLKHDISVPIQAMADFDRELQVKLHAACPGIRPVVFGHIGDGNLHYNLTQPKALSRKAYLDRASELSAIVYESVWKHGGSISAEHGIGQAKRDLLVEHMGAAGSEVLRNIKQALDPEKLLNPGKLVKDCAE